jgi:uncharacterized protein YkwD
MRRRGIIAVTALLLAFALIRITATPTPIAATTAQPTVSVTPPTPEELLKYTNIERAKAGVAPLVLDQRLNQSAQLKADDMATNKYYDHISPTTGKHGYEYGHELVPECKSLTENQMKYIDTSQNTVSVWMDSLAHREAIIDAKFDIVGYAISEIYTVQHLCDLP